MLMCEQPRRSSVVNRCSCQLSQLLRETELDYHRPAFSFILLMVGRRCGAAQVQRKATERFCTLSLHLKNAKNDIPFGHQGISFIGRVRFDFIWHLDEGESVSETFRPHGWRSTQSATSQIVLSILKLTKSHLLLHQPTFYDSEWPLTWMSYILLLISVNISFCEVKITLNCLQRQGKNYFRMVIKEKAIV